MEGYTYLVEEGNGQSFYVFDNEHDANIFREALWNDCISNGRPTSVTVHRAHRPSHYRLLSLGIEEDQGYLTTKG